MPIFLWCLFFHNLILCALIPDLKHEDILKIILKINNYEINAFPATSLIALDWLNWLIFEFLYTLDMFSIFG